MAAAAAAASSSAAKGARKPIIFLVVILIIIASSLVSSAHSSHPSNIKKKKKKLPQGPGRFVFYFHNQVYNPAVNNSVFSSVYSAGPLNFSQPNPYSFGVRSTFEAPITSGPSPNDTQIGVAQGIWILNSQKFFALLHLFTATITSGPYTGTIAIFGQEYEPIPTRYLPIVGGTGDFLGARGVATSNLTFINHVPPAHWTLKFDCDLYY